MPVLLDRIKIRCEVDPVSGCWIWKSATNGTGYPTVNLSGICGIPIYGVAVRRLVYLIAVGELSARRAVINKCGEIKCVCPDHLQAVPKKQVATSNMHSWDGTAEQRRNVRHYKLDHAKAAEIRLLAERGYKSREIADRYGVTCSLVRRVVRGQLWTKAARAQSTWHP